jgi:putative ABC transport system permease protein
VHKMVATTIWGALVLTSIVAFQLFITTDEVQPAGTRGSFRIVKVDVATKETAIDTIAGTARELHCNIFLAQSDLRGATNVRTLFAFIGDVDTFDSNGGYTYPEFSPRTVATRVVPADTITTEDLRGDYVTSANPGQVARIRTMLDRKGLTTDDASVSRIGNLIYSVGRGNLAASLFVVVLALGLAISQATARNRKIYSLRALHGSPRIKNVGTEILGHTSVYGLGLLGLLVLGLPFLGFYNHFRQALGFLRLLAVAIVILYLAIIVLVAFTVLSLPRGNTPEVLKGERPSLRNGLFAAGIQVTVLAIVLATTTAAMSRIEAVHDTQDVYGTWSEGSALYAARLSTTTSSTHEEFLRNAPGFAAAVTSLERADQTLLVGYKGAAVEEFPEQESADPTFPEGSRSMLVNNEYLERQTVRDTGGRRITDLPSGKDRFTLLVPQSYDGDPKALLRRYVDYFRDFGCVVGRPDDSFSCDPKGSVIITRAGQDLFTYSGTEFMPAEQQGKMFLNDPVLAVVSASSELLSPEEYLSYCSMDDMLFSDPSALDHALREHGVRGYFQGIDNAADAVAGSMALARQELAMDAFSLTLGWALLILSSLVMVAVYADRRKRPMFVELIHGYPFLSRHWPYLAGATTLSVAGIGIAGIVGGSLTQGRDVAVAAAFLTTQVVISLVAIRSYEALFRADYIKRY